MGNSIKGASHQSRSPTATITIKSVLHLEAMSGFVEMNAGHVISLKIMNGLVRKKHLSEMALREGLSILDR